MGAFLATCWRSRWVSAVCLAVVAAALLLPPEGPGVPLCTFRTITHMPCFACGLTRSFIGCAHLDLRQAAFFNPVGLMLFPLVVYTAALLGAPRRVRERAAAGAVAHGGWWTAFGIAALGLFVVNGVARMVWVAMTGRPSPW